MIDQLETLALKSIALKDNGYFYRRVCRYYSEKFHTPLMSVYDLPWPFVFTNYLEHVIESNNTREDIYNLAIDVCYPEKSVSEEDEMQDWIRRIEEEEAAKRHDSNPPVAEEKPIVENPQIEEPNIDMGGDAFAHLEEEMKEEDE